MVGSVFLLGPHGWVTTDFKQNAECGYSLEMGFDNSYIFQYKDSIGVKILKKNFFNCLVISVDFK